MATTDKTKPVEDLPADLLPILRASSILPDKRFEEIKARVREGSYPFDPMALAQRLVREKVLTEYQARRLLSNKPQNMKFGNRYVILDRLGSGSMGRVYKAQHLLMGREVALKVIAPEIVSNERVVARFQREMKLAAKLDHPNVVRAYDADREGKSLYIVMEYVAGQSLGQRYRAKGPMAPMDVAEYAAQAAAGLAHAHSQGVVHRDVKPSNLFLSYDKQVKVLDLGLGVLMENDDSSSFATADGIAVGTIDYMSPEQACGKEVDGRSDLYSLGCAMYHLISGRLPFPGDSPVERLGKRINGRPQPIAELVPHVPAGLAEVMGQLLANKPHERFQSANEVAEVLRDLLPVKEPSGVGRRPASRDGMPTSGQPGASASVVVSLPPPEPEIVEVRPEYPAWFRPLADLAERSPWGALTVTLLGLFLAFGLGFLTRMIIR
ncbi:MAG: serine/threonine protein kinase [Planctomycetota bacterium]|nr:serine/threonine protein kinase [Planctomycetota bacterium]